MLNGYAARGTSAAATSVSLLLVEPDPVLAEYVEARLREAVPTLGVTHCDTLGSARAYLSGTVFDAVCTADELPDGSGLALLELLDTLRVATPCFVRAQSGRAEAARQAGATACLTLDAPGESEAFAEIARQLAARAGDEEQPSTSVHPFLPARLEPTDAEGWLEALRLETGAVAHAINNPLTVITGNAQLLCEMARLTGLDPAVAKPIEDIEVAARQLSGALEHLAALRQQLAEVLGSDDGL